VAIKELLLQEGLDEDRAAEARARAIREGRIAARLQHPHAIAVFDVVEDSGRPWLIMEYLPSESLAAVLTERGRLPVDEVVRIGYQLASALAAAHDAGIVHRDVTPGNVLIGSDGTVKLTDFGISRAAGDATLTATGQIAGTPAFLAPEVARGESTGFPADVFSLGATLYAAVEGTPPFGIGDNTIALLHRVATGKSTPPGNAGALTPVLMRLLRARADERPSMTEALRLLEDLRVEPTVGTPPPPAATPTVARDGAPRRSTRIALVVLTVAALLGAGALVLALNQGGDGVAAPSGNKIRVGSAPESPPRSPPSAPASSTPSSTPPPSKPVPTRARPASSKTPARAITDYYALVPNDLRAGYATLTEGFKQTHAPTFASYQSFWNQMRTVDVSAVSARHGNTVSATLTYVYTTGKTLRENDTYTLVRHNGKWSIDTQQPG
ncbi:MAG: serine/threonine-protein kinase, partial [Sciscionella sp.]